MAINIVKKQVRLPRGEAGQTLLEVLVAFSVAILVLGAIVTVVITSLSNVQYSKNQNLATFYAQEGLAIIRQIRDSNWTKFVSYTGNTEYCFNSDLKDLFVAPIPLSPCRESGNMIGGIFARDVVFEHNSNSCCPDNTNTCASSSTGGVRAMVTVAWTDNKCSDTPYCHKAELISCFFNSN